MLRVLVLDEDPELASDAASYLNQFAHSAATAVPRFEDALAITQTRSFDVVLVNLHQKSDSDNGFAAAQLIRQKTGLPVFFLSAYSEDCDSLVSDPSLRGFVHRRHAFGPGLLARRYLIEMRRNPTLEYVLVGDDDPVIQWAVAAHFQHLGYAVHFAANGSEALHLFSMIRYSAVLMDYQMPEMDGVMAIKRIRELETQRGSPACPVFMMTSHPLDKLQSLCASVAVDGIFPKPLNAALFAQILSRTGRSIVSVMSGATQKFSEEREGQFHRRSAAIPERGSAS